MKSVEIRFNEALAVLKAKTSPAKFTEVAEKYSKLPTIEAKLNCVEAAIAEVVKENDPLGLTSIEEVMTDPSVAILFGREPRQVAQPTREAAPIKKHSGSAEHFVEGSPFNVIEGRSAAFVEGASPDSIFAKADAIMLETMTHPDTKQPLTEAEKAKVRGGKPAAYANFTETQKKDYDFARLVGISEADALRVATL